MPARRVGAVDIGSNAARLLICDAKKKAEGGGGGIERVMAVRIPLRLGGPVFRDGRIGGPAGARLLDCMRGFRRLADSQETSALRGCATAAMREAADGAAWAARAATALGGDIRVIDGREEARILARSVSATERKDDATRGGGGVGLLVDVGGGSADACAFRDGEVLAAESFTLGAVRGLVGEIPKSEWERFQKWMGATAKRFGVSELTACGGNTRRLGKILGADRVGIRELEALRDELSRMTPAARAARHGLRLDRADVIVPAAEICCAGLRGSGLSVLRIPRNAGLTDGMIREMAEGVEGGVDTPAGVGV